MTPWSVEGEAPPGYGTTVLVIGDARYWAVAGLETTITHEGTAWREPHRARIVNQCESCGRGDWEPVVAYSVEEAVELGMLVRVPS